MQLRSKLYNTADYKHKKKKKKKKISAYFFLSNLNPSVPRLNIFNQNHMNSTSL